MGKATKKHDLIKRLPELVPEDSSPRTEKNGKSPGRHFSKLGVNNFEVITDSLDLIFQEKLNLKYREINAANMKLDFN